VIKNHVVFIYLPVYQWTIKKTSGSGLFLGMIFGLLFFFVATGNFCGIRVYTKVRNFEGNFLIELTYITVTNPPTEVLLIFMRRHRFATILFGPSLDK